MGWSFVGGQAGGRRATCRFGEQLLVAQSERVEFALLTVQSVGKFLLPLFQVRKA